MAIVKVPEKGQPIDVAYLYTLAEAINTLSKGLTTATYNYTTIDSPGVGKNSIRTADAKIVGGYIKVTTDSNVTAAQIAPFTYSYPADFKYIPIATATPINSGLTAAGEDVTVVLTDVSKSKVSGFVRYNASGKASTAVNIIVIGIPN